MPGIDALFVGPYDLSSSLGVLGQLEHESVVAAVTRVVDVARKSGLALGAFGVDAERLRMFTSRGATLLTVGIDAQMLTDTARATAASARALLAE